MVLVFRYISQANEIIVRPCGQHGDFSAFRGNLSLICYCTHGAISSVFSGIPL
jgi:hypothetical protein